MKKSLYKKIMYFACAISLIISSVTIPVNQKYASAEQSAGAYEPKNVMATLRGNGVNGLNISYVNPSKPLKKVSIYSVLGDAESLLSDNLSVSANRAVKYAYDFTRDTDADDYKTYNVNFRTVKLNFEFSDGVTREVYVSGGANNGGFTSVYHKNNDKTFASTGVIFTQANSEMPMAQVNVEDGGASDAYALHLKMNESVSNNYYTAPSSKNITIRWEKQNQEYVNAGCKYRISAKVKGNTAGALYIRDAGAPRQVGASLSLVNISDIWSEISADYTAIEPLENQIDFTFSDLTVGDLWIDDLKIELYDEDGKTIKSTVYNDSFEVVDQYTAKIPKAIIYKTNTDTVISWKPYEYSAYTNVYENIDGELFLRAKLPNFGPNAKTKIKFKGTDKEYVLKSESGTLCGNNISAVGGPYIPYVSGTYSDGVIPTEYPMYECIKKCEEVQELLSGCEKAGISTDYETADYTVMRLFTDYLEEEYLLWDNIDLANKYRSDIDEIYQRTKGKLTEYLNGTDKPLNVPKLSNGTLRLKNGHQYDEKGNPVILVGFNDFLAPNDFVETADKLGLNMTQRGLYISKMIKYDAETDGYIPMGYDEPKRGAGYDYNISQTIEFLDECRKNNVKVNLMFEPMSIAYVPDTDFKDTGVTYYGYIGYNATHPRVKQQVDAAAKVFINIVKDYQDVVTGICFANEPFFLTNDKPYYDEYWTEYIKKKYPTPESLYETYSTYDYSEVKRPVSDFSQPEDVLYRDYRDFNENVLCEYFSYMSDALKREKQAQGVTADIPLSVKLMINVGEKIGEEAVDGRDRRRHGVNYEKISKLVDVNGIDTGQSIYRGKQDIESFSMWRDYVTSVSNRMISDMELHVANDTGRDGEYISYPDGQASWTKGLVWQSAIQGADEMSLWFFGRDERSRNDYPNASFLLKPKELTELSKTALDIRRLSNEITRIQDAERKVAILWSDTSYTFNRQMSNVAYYAYKACRDNGEKPLFVTESTLNRLSERDLLLVPGCINISKSALTAIKNFKGKIVLLGDSSVISKNEDDKANDSNTLSTIKEKADTYNIKLNKWQISVKDTNPNFDETDLTDYIKQKLDNCGLGKVVIKDRNGNRLKDVEWTYVKGENDMLINVYNKTSDDIKGATVFIDGIKIVGFKELISDTRHTEAFDINAYEPALLSVSFPIAVSDYEWISNSSDVYEAKVQVENLSDSDKTVPKLVAAVYKENVLNSVGISESKIKMSSTETLTLKVSGIYVPKGSEVKLMLIDDWKSLKPLMPVEIK